MKFLVIILLLNFLFSCGKETRTKIIKQGQEVQNGGYGVVIENEDEKEKVVSLDLYLRGSHLDPLIHKSIQYLQTAEIETIYAYFGPIFSHDVIDIVLGKLSDLRYFSEKIEKTYLVSHLIENVKNYRWIVLDNGKCTDVKDDNTPISNKVQLAYRKSNWIRFCKKFHKMDQPNQAALILHEMIYASMIDHKSRTVEMVGLIFHKDVYDFNRKTQAELTWILKELERHQKVRSQYLVLDQDEKHTQEIEVEGRIYCFSKGHAFWTDELYAFYPKKDNCNNLDVFGENVNFLIKNGRKFYLSLEKLEMPKIKHYSVAVGEVEKNEDEDEESESEALKFCQDELADNCTIDPETGLIVTPEEFLQSVKK